MSVNFVIRVVMLCLEGTKLLELEQGGVIQS